MNRNSSNSTFYEEKIIIPPNSLTMLILFLSTTFGTFGNALNLWALRQEKRNKQSSPSTICLKFLSYWNLLHSACVPVFVMLSNLLDPETVLNVAYLQLAIGK